MIGIQPNTLQIVFKGNFPQAAKFAALAFVLIALAKMLNGTGSPFSNMAYWKQMVEVSIRVDAG